MNHEIVSTTRLSPLQERKKASVLLAQLKDLIIDIWQDRVLQSVSSAPSKSALVIRNQVPELIDDLIKIIDPNPGHIAMAEILGKEHGEQRANLTDYTASEVLREYRILRQVIFEVLEEQQIQVSEVRDIILNVLDTGIEKAIEQFSLTRSEELNRSNKELANFAGIVAHDLKSPLATILGFGEVLQEELSDRLKSEESESLSAIRRSATHMTELINRLLEYASVGSEERPFVKVDLQKIVQNVVDSLKSSIDDAHGRIHFMNLPVVDGDEAFLSQVFQNFISNTLKFRKPNTSPEIQITAKSQGPNWLFTVRDNGIGFDPKEKENIFSLFKRLDRKKSAAGQGIGLATVRKVIEFHGGTIWAESQPNAGSTFYFTLPMITRNSHH